MDDQEQQHRDDMAYALRGMPKRSRKVPRLERLREIVAQKQACRMEGLLMDATTANMLVTIHDALSSENQAKFLALPLRRMVAVGWKLVP